MEKMTDFNDYSGLKQKLFEKYLFYLIDLHK